MISQAQARTMVRRAIERGDLHRPAFCSECGADPGPGKDGRACIHAHHFNGYDRPLDVQWLCVRCHRAETPFPDPAASWMRRHPERVRGSGNAFSKLTEATVAEILERLAAGEQGKLIAPAYGISAAVVSAINRGQAWRHVPRLKAKIAEAASPGGGPSLATDEPK